jgi:hypothetical protein
LALGSHQPAGAMRPDFFHPARRLLLAALLWVSSNAYPQAQAPVVGQNTGLTRSIEGSVLTKSGEAVAGAVVLLKDTKTLQVRTYIAQSNGHYHFYGLSTDVNYQLRAEANGLTSKTRTVSVFDSHKVVKLNLKLSKKMKQD